MLLVNTGRRAISRKSHLRRKYRMTLAQYEALWAAQGGTCAVCPAVLVVGGSTHVDHDHACCPGKYTCGKCVRGLLCTRCNMMLGFAKDNPEILEAGAAYLRVSRSGSVP